MSDQQVAANTIRTTADQALQSAWRRFLDYDDAAAKQRGHHTRIRTWIIILGLLASTLAVISSYKNDAALTAFVAGYGPVASASIDVFWAALHIILIFVPIIIAGLLTYAYQFAPSLSWVAYRVGAELVRREIYLYRMQSGDYAGKNALDQQQTLLQRLNEANLRVNKIGAPDPYLQTTNNDVAKAVVGRTNDKADDGFSPLTADQYINYRVLPQKDWYIKKSQSDYENMRRWRIFGLAAAAGSSAVAALGVEPVVAITTAIGTALATYMELNMYGRTFNIYHPLANQLEIELNKWSILSPAQQSDPALISKFVGTAEDLFQSEREQWMQQAVQSQQAIEQTLGKTVGGGQNNSSTTAATPSDSSNQTTVSATVLSQADALTSVISIQTPGNTSDGSPQSQVDVVVAATTNNVPPAPDNGTVITTTAQPVIDTSSNGSSPSTDGSVPLTPDTVPSAAPATTDSSASPANGSVPLTPDTVPSSAPATTDSTATTSDTSNNNGSTAPATTDPTTTTPDASASNGNGSAAPITVSVSNGQSTTTATVDPTQADANGNVTPVVVTDPVAVVAANGSNGASADGTTTRHPADNGDGSAG